MTSWDQELGATNKPLCVGCGGVGRTLSRCAGRAARLRLRLRRHGRRSYTTAVDRVRDAYRVTGDVTGGLGRG